MSKSKIKFNFSERYLIVKIRNIHFKQIQASTYSSSSASITLCGQFEKSDSFSGWQVSNG
jgi:hypothetical protein